MPADTNRLFWDQRANLLSTRDEYARTLARAMHDLAMADEDEGVSLDALLSESEASTLHCEYFWQEPEDDSAEHDR